MGNMSTNAYAKFRCAVLRIKKALGIFRELITTTITTTTTRVAFRDPPFGSKNQIITDRNCIFTEHTLLRLIASCNNETTSSPSTPEHLNPFDHVTSRPIARPS